MNADLLHRNLYNKIFVLLNLCSSANKPTPVDMALCRLCSGNEQVFDIFHSEIIHKQQLRLSIFLATGIEIKQSDLVTKMVCHRCCEIAVKLHKYRINAMANDKILKEQCGQPYTPPIVNQEDILRLAAKIASEQVKSYSENDSNAAESDLNSDSKQKLNQSYETSAISSQPKQSIINDKNEPKKHYSIRKLYKEYGNIVLPEAVFKSDISPVISLNSVEVTDWYLEQASRIQKRLTNVVIRKIPSASTVNNRGKTDASAVPLNTMDTICNGISNNNGGDNKDRSNCQNENDASTINTIHQFDLANEKLPIPATKMVNQKSKKKRGRKFFTERKRRKRPVADEGEVFSEKRIRGFNSKDPNVVFNEVDMRERRIHDETHQDEILTPSAYHLKLAPSGLLSTSTYIATSPGPSLLESNLVSSSLSPPSVASGITTPSTSSSECDPNGLLLEYADREHIMVAEQSVPVYFCSVCNKLFDSRKQLKDHERVHLRCKFCKIRVKTISSLNRHLSESCFINIVENPPNLQLTRVDYIPETVNKYPEAFEELFILRDMKRSDSPVPVTDTNRTSVSQVKDNENFSIYDRSISTSANPLDEKEIIDSLVRKYYSPVDFRNQSEPAIILKNKILPYKIPLDLLPELRKYQIQVLLEHDSKLSAKSQKKPSDPTRCIESWADTKVIEVRMPSTSYGARRMFQTNLDTFQINRGVPQTNTNVISNGKPISHT